MIISEWEKKTHLDRLKPTYIWSFTDTPPSV